MSTRADSPGYHKRGCPQHVHPTQRDPGVIAICTCGGRGACYGERSDLWVHHWQFTIDADNVPSVACARCGMYWMLDDFVHP